MRLERLSNRNIFRQDDLPAIVGAALAARKQTIVVNCSMKIFTFFLGNHSSFKDLAPKSAAPQRDYL
jgi:hypothetical protein